MVSNCNQIDRQRWFSIHNWKEQTISDKLEKKIVSEAVESNKICSSKQWNNSDGKMTIVTINKVEIKSTSIGIDWAATAARTNSFSLPISSPNSRFALIRNWFSWIYLLENGHGFISSHRMYIWNVIYLLFASFKEFLTMPMIYQSAGYWCLGNHSLGVSCTQAMHPKPIFWESFLLNTLIRSLWTELLYHYFVANSMETHHLSNISLLYSVESTYVCGVEFERYGWRCSSHLYLKATTSW